MNSSLPPKSRKLQTSKHPGSSFVFMLTSEWLPFLYVTWMCSVLSCMSFCRHVFNILVYAYTFRSSISGSLKPRLNNTWPRALRSSPPRGPSAHTAPPLLVPHSSSFSFHQVLFMLCSSYLTFADFHPFLCLTLTPSLTSSLDVSHFLREIFPVLHGSFESPLYQDQAFRTKELFGLGQ